MINAEMANDAIKFANVTEELVDANRRMNEAKREVERVEKTKADLAAKLITAVGSNIRIKLFPVNPRDFVLVEYHEANWTSVDVVKAEK